MPKVNNRPNRKSSKCYIQDKIFDLSRDGSLASRTEFHDQGEAAGVATWRRIVKENVPQRSGVTKDAKVDFSLLQPGNGLKPDHEMRLDPSHFQASAGAKLKPGALELWQETGVVVNLKRQERTDPITHFKHENVKFQQQHQLKKRGKRRPEGTHPAAMQSWTWQRDKASRDRAIEDSKHGKIQRFVKDQTGAWVYCIHGVEDLRPAATKNYLKCEKAPKKEHIKYNDKVQMPCCIRDNVPGKRDCLKPPNDWPNSKRIWNCLVDEAYEKVLAGESPQPGQAGAFHRSKSSKKRVLMEQEILKDAYERGEINDAELVAGCRAAWVKAQREQAEIDLADSPARAYIAGRSRSYSEPFVGLESSDKRGSRRSQSSRRSSGSREFVVASQAGSQAGSQSAREGGSRSVPPTGSQAARETSSRAREASSRKSLDGDPWAKTRPAGPGATSDAPSQRPRSAAAASRSSKASSCMSEVSITNSQLQARTKTKTPTPPELVRPDLQKPWDETMGPWYGVDFMGHGWFGASNGFDADSW